jgi:Flp pilus assembly protein TadB
MKLVIVALCFSIAAAIWTRPLPSFAISNRVRIPNHFLKRREKTKICFEDQLQFIFNLRSQLNAGVNQVDALKFAVSRVPEFAFENTKQAIASQANLIPALHRDSIQNSFPDLINCAHLLELGLNSGSSISAPLSQIAQSLINRRKHEQLISTELASTKASVFVLAGLPIIGFAMGLILGADSISWLLGTGAGRVCLLLGLALELVGWLWIRQLLNRALADVT